MTAQRKLITFLGAGPYYDTLYGNPRPVPFSQPSTVQSSFVQEALVAFFQPDATTVFLTDTAKSARPRTPEGIPDPEAEPYWERLQRALQGKTQVLPVDIPDKPQTEADVWDIFRRIQENVTEGDTLYFDITYGFRSIPVIALVAVSFLRLVCGAKIEALVYGAFEARRDSGQINEKGRKISETPIFDLLPIAGLLDWTVAADQFLKTGVAQPLARLVQRLYRKSSQVLIA